MNKKRNLLIMIIAFSLILILGSSYAYLMYTKESTNNYVINVGTLEVTFVDSETQFLNLTNMYPMTDDEGKAIDNELVFQVQNTGNVDSSYDISIEEISSNPEFKSVIKYIVNKDNEGYKEPKILGEDKYIETGGFLKPNGTADYRVKVWLAEEADNTYMNKEFKAKVVVKGNQGLNLDKSGANPPKLLSNMLPVYYDAKTETDGVWKIADKNNHDETYKWYDYDKFMWANAVTVKETNGTLNSDSSMTFDGVDDYYSLGHENYDFKDKISVVARIKVNKYTNEYQTILGRNDGISLGVGHDYSNNRFYFSIFSNGSWRHIDSSVKPNLDTWYTVVGTYDGETEKIYIDGNLNFSSVLTGNINTIDDTLFLGKRGSNVQPSNVTVSDAFVYTDALTDSEIKEYFSGEITDYPKDNLLVEKTEFNELDARQKYLEASAGTEIPMDDITSMWVWIPRYKYTIFNGNNGTSNEQMINVDFENGIETTGTVSCHDNIKTDDDSASSEICEDKTNGKIIDMKSTYTHPAFTFGDENLTGFWFSKFEMATDDQTCLTNQNSTSCNKLGFNLLIKPNQISLRYQTLGNLFTNIRNMETFNNIHGFVQSDNSQKVTNNSNFDGTLLEDSNNFDTHMVKNMEWGAVAYLTMSKYGKYGNNLYNGEYKEVYQNNYQEYINDYYIMKTGYSGKVPNSAFSKNGVLYNNLTIETLGQGYIGAGASTTGTVYGIYDMAGGASNFVMANMVSKDNTYNTNLNSPIIDKYYDKYSYNLTNETADSRKRGKLGDATKEVQKKLETNGSAWYDDDNRLFFANEPASAYYIGRSGFYIINNSHGIFQTAQLSGFLASGITSRPVLTIS